MDQLMRKESTSQGNYQSNDAQNRKLTCCVHFINPRQSSPTTTDDEPESVTCLVSRAEDLDPSRVFQRDSLDMATNRSLFEFGHNFEDVPDWLKIEQPSKLPLRDVLRYMVEKHLKTSVQVKIDKLYFNCHVIVLQVYSKYFMDLQEIPLVVTLPEQKVSQKAFLLVYQWMLSDKPRLDRKSIVAVFIAATYLRIDALLQHCWKYFEDINCFNEATACVMYVEAKGNPALDIVRNLMLTRIRKFLLTFVATRDFLDVPISHLVYLLSSDDICINTEIEILFIIVRWLGHDWQKRRVHVESLVSCLRFHLMPLWYLLCARRVETNQHMREVLSMPKVDASFNVAIAKITASMYAERGDNDINTLSGKHSHILEDTPQRCWIHDKACPYFHLIGCPHTRDIIYTKFESYLTNLQQQPLNHWMHVEELKLDKINTNCCLPKTTAD